MGQKLRLWDSHMKISGFLGLEDIHKVTSEQLFAEQPLSFAGKRKQQYWICLPQVSVLFPVPGWKWHIFKIFFKYIFLNILILWEKPLLCISWKTVTQMEVSYDGRSIYCMHFFVYRSTRKAIVVLFLSFVIAFSVVPCLTWSE